MKTVNLIVTVMMLSFGAAAQTTPSAAPKRTVAPPQKKTKDPKVKRSGTIVGTVENTAITTLTGEKSDKAKGSFEQVLLRRLEIDAARADGERQQQMEQ